VVLIALGALAPWQGALAQQRQKVSFDVPAESTKYTQQHVIDVGDVPGHQVRVFELQRIYGKGAPSVDGLRLKESWVRGMTDYTDLSGAGTTYITYVAENGDRIYARGQLVAQGPLDGGGKAAHRNLSVHTITGGTGKFVGIRGVVHAETTANPPAGINTSKGEMEYWMEK